MTAGPADSHLEGRYGGPVAEFCVPVLNIDYDQAVSDLAACGWARAPHALAASAADLLAEDNGRPWTVVGDEGVVRQHVLGSYAPYAEALPVVRAVGDQLITGLSAAASKRAWPSPRRLLDHDVGVAHPPAAPRGPVLVELVAESVEEPTEAAGCSRQVRDPQLDVMEEPGSGHDAKSSGNPRPSRS